MKRIVEILRVKQITTDEDLDTDTGIFEQGGDE